MAVAAWFPPLKTIYDDMHNQFWIICHSFCVPFPSSSSSLSLTWAVFVASSMAVVDAAAPGDESFVWVHTDDVDDDNDSSIAFRLYVSHVGQLWLLSTFRHSQSQRRLAVVVVVVDDAQYLLSLWTNMPLLPRNKTGKGSKKTNSASIATSTICKSCVL